MVDGTRALGDLGVRQTVDLLLVHMKWTECLHEAGSLHEALCDMAAIFDARIVHLHRVANPGGRRRTVASVDLDLHDGARPLTHAVGPWMAGIHRARPGSVWMLGDLDGPARGDLDERCRSWLSDRRIRDVAVIPLDASDPEITLLELYFGTPPTEAARSLLCSFALAAEAAWSRRQHGLVARLLAAAPSVERHQNGARSAGSTPLLSPSNPCGLTAAETRICRMIQCGYTVSEIVERSRISKSTLRCHLRNIYSKAEVAGHVGLVRLLLAQDRGPAATLTA
jgi:DNA-binding CsgD family transcriptional regulator